MPICSGEVELAVVVVVGVVVGYMFRCGESGGGECDVS